MPCHRTANDIRPRPVGAPWTSISCPSHSTEAFSTDRSSKSPYDILKEGHVHRPRVADCFFRIGRIREAGWKVAVHGYERVGAFKHLGSTTFTKYSLNLDRDLNNGRLFYGRWDEAIRRGSARARHRWRRPMTAGAWMHTLRMIGNYAVPSRRQAILNGEW